MCQPDGFYPPLTAEDITVSSVHFQATSSCGLSKSWPVPTRLAVMQNLNEKIDQQYRVRLILDNLPVTTYDLEENPESVRPGFELGYEKDGKRFINNHLMFKILVHQTNGQYTRAKENMAEIEAAAIVEVRFARSRFGA